jgi:hypothetical protein
MKRIVPAFTLVLLVASTGVFAQANSKPITGHIAGGYAEPLGSAGDFVDAGWNISGGVTMHPNPQKPFGIRFDLGYSWFDANKQTLDSANNSGATVRVDDGYASMGNLSIDGLYEFGGKGHIGGYFGAGISSYTRYWALTREALVSGIYCDPWTGWCYPYTTTGDAIADNDRLTKIGWNAVLAVTFPLQSGSEIYIEAAYHRMNTDPATEYLPIVLGIRW